MVLAGMVFQNARQCRHMAGLIIQRADVIELPAAGLYEQMRIFEGDFLQGLQTVDRKTRADHINRL
jgi:hypothetical protein